MDPVIQSLLDQLKALDSALAADLRPFLEKIMAGNYTDAEIRMLIRSILAVAASRGKAVFDAVAAIASSISRYRELRGVSALISEGATLIAAEGESSAAASAALAAEESAFAPLATGLIAGLAWFGGLLLAAGKMGELGIRLPGSPTPCDERLAAISKALLPHLRLHADKTASQLKHIASASGMIRLIEDYLRNCGGHDGRADVEALRELITRHLEEVV